MELSKIRHKNKKKLNNKEFFDTIFLSYSMCISKPAQKEFIILYNHHVPDKNEINMIEKTISRAEIASNQQILDLGCGWGSFTIYAAQKFPESIFTCVSNSTDQIEFIKQEAKKRKLAA